LKVFWIAVAVLVACRSNTEGATASANASSSSSASSTSLAQAANENLLPNMPAQSVVTAGWTDTKAVFDTSLNAPNMQCAPKLATRSDTIAIRAEIPHGGQLSVEQPDGTVFSLVMPPDKRSPDYSLVDAESFRNILVLRFRADIRSRPSVYGRDTLEPIFRVPGDYRFTLGENLATEYDEEDPNWHCTIHFQPVDR
jgi:hypothetical protein